MRGREEIVLQSEYKDILIVVALFVSTAAPSVSAYNCNREEEKGPFSGVVCHHSVLPLLVLRMHAIHVYTYRSQHVSQVHWVKWGFCLAAIYLPNCMHCMQ